MDSPRLLRRCLLATLSAVLLASAAVLPAQADTGQAATGQAGPEPKAAAAVTFSDTFDGAAGSAVNSSKWQIETGDNVNNHERQYYTSGANNAALDGQGHLVITARTREPEQLPVLVRAL